MWYYIIYKKLKSKFWDIQLSGKINFWKFYFVLIKIKNITHINNKVVHYSELISHRINYLKIMTFSDVGSFQYFTRSMNSILISFISVGITIVYGKITVKKNERKTIFLLSAPYYHNGLYGMLSLVLPCFISSVVVQKISRYYDEVSWRRIRGLKWDSWPQRYVYSFHLLYTYFIYLPFIILVTLTFSKSLRF